MCSYFIAFNNIFSPNKHIFSCRVSIKEKLKKVGNFLFYIVCRELQ